MQVEGRGWGLDRLGADSFKQRSIGVMYALKGQGVVREKYMGVVWDYGRSMPCTLLCTKRRGSAYMKGGWH